MVEKTQQVFHDYVNIKLHFRDPSYRADHFRENSKIMRFNYKTRKDLKFFEQLASYFSHRSSLIEYFISGFLENPGRWIGDFIEDSDQLIEEHRKRMNRCRNLVKVFEEDCQRMSSSYTLKELLGGGGTPKIFFEGGCKETLAVLDHLTGFCQSGTASNDLAWKRDSLTISKYKYLLKFNFRDINCVIKSTFLTPEK